MVTAFLFGCASIGPRREDLAIAPPKMPTVRRVSVEAQPTVPEGELFSRAIALAEKNDFDAAIRSLDGASDAARPRLAGELAAALARRDPSRGAAVADAFPPGREQTAAIEAAAHEFTAHDADAALRWAHAGVKASTAGTARRVVAGDLVQDDPRTAVDRVLALPPGSARDDLLGFVAAAWARRDPNAAVAWVRDLPSNERRQRLTSTVGFEIAQRNPDQAIALAEMLPAGRDRWLLFSAIAQTWVATDSKAALAWAGKLPTGEARDAAFAGVETGLGVPAARLRSSGPGMRGGSSSSSPHPAALDWPELSSPEFAAWLATQRPGMARDEAILEYVRQRGALEPSAIGPWLVSLAGGPTRDQAMQIYVESLSRTAPAEAARWVRSLPRSDRTDEMMDQTAERWLRANPDAASAWILETPMAPERRERLMREAGIR
jgi:hypothetical protein